MTSFEMKNSTILRTNRLKKGVCAAKQARSGECRMLIKQWLDRFVLQFSRQWLHIPNGVYIRHRYQRTANKALSILHYGYKNDVTTNCNR